MLAVEECAVDILKDIFTSKCVKDERCQIQMKLQGSGYMQPDC